MRLPPATHRIGQGARTPRHDQQAGRVLIAAVERAESKLDWCEHPGEIPRLRFLPAEAR